MSKFIDNFWYWFLPYFINSIVDNSLLIISILRIWILTLRWRIKVEWDDRRSRFKNFIKILLRQLNRCSGLCWTCWGKLWRLIFIVLFGLINLLRLINHLTFLLCILPLILFFWLHWYRCRSYFLFRFRFWLFIGFAFKLWN